MAIELARETQEQLITSIKRYFDENLDGEIGDLGARLLLDFCVKEIGPSIYNQAVADVQALIKTRVEDLGVSCYEHEFGYWGR